MHKRSHTIFGRAKHSGLAKDVKIKTPQQARGTVKRLSGRFNRAKTHKERLTVYRALGQARSRASVISRNTRNSLAVRKRFRRVRNELAKGQKALGSELRTERALKTGNYGNVYAENSRAIARTRIQSRRR